MTNYKFTVLIVAIMVLVLGINQTVLAGKAKDAVWPTDTVMPTQNTPLPEELSVFSSASLALSGSPLTLGCFDQLDQLPSSSTYQQSDWELAFIEAVSSPFGSSGMQGTLVDLNGDGLVDYAIADISEGGSSLQYQACVYLNTGSGFEPAYRCRAYLYASNGAYTSGTYFGDCAAL